VALAPLLVVVVGAGPLRAFALGLVTGAVHFAGSLYWITHVMIVYGGLQPVVAALVNAALVAYLALFPAVFALIVNRVVHAYGPRTLLVAPLVWVATELGRTHLFTGFPWVLLGYSQVAVAPVAQLAAVCGVYGVSALVALVSAAAAAVAVRAWAVRPYLPAAAALAVVVAVAAGGAWRVRSGRLLTAGDEVRVGLVQGNVDQAEKWDRSRAAGIFESYLGATREAIDRGAQLVVWPESSTPFQFEEDLERAERIRRLASAARVWILLGSDQIDRGVPVRYYNAAFLVRPDGRTAGVYRKMHLVPFGEYVPLRRVFFFAESLVQAVSDFSAGEEPVLLPVDGRSVSTAICYEIVYPDLVRRSVADGSELLTTITNDAWFGRSSAPYQHFAQARMRAIENGRYLVRAANTGVSGVVDPYGRVVVDSDIFEPAVIVAAVRYLDGVTPYVRAGDAFAYAATAGTLALVVAARGSRRRMRSHGHR
jgi:apolipoprotein N-acyltransferase